MHSNNDPPIVRINNEIVYKSPPSAFHIHFYKRIIEMSVSYKNNIAWNLQHQFIMYGDCVWKSLDVWSRQKTTSGKTKSEKVKLSLTTYFIYHIWLVYFMLLKGGSWIESLCFDRVSVAVAPVPVQEHHHSCHCHCQSSLPVTKNSSWSSCSACL